MRGVTDCALGNGPVPVPASLADLYRLHRRRVAAYFRKRGFRWHDAEDLTHDVFVRLSRCERRLIEQRGEAMIYRVAGFVWIDTLRALSPTGKRTPSEEIDAGEGSDHATPERHVLARDELRKALTICESIPRRQREAFLAHRLHGLSYGEIAAERHVSIKTVEKQIAKGAVAFEMALRTLGLNTDAA